MPIDLDSGFADGVELSIGAHFVTEHLAEDDDEPLVIYIAYVESDSPAASAVSGWVVNKPTSGGAAVSY